MTNEFFKENGTLLYGQRFGRAIKYRLTRNSTGKIQVEFEHGIVHADDEQRMPQKMLASKEALVCNAICELAREHKTVYVCFKVYGKTLKATAEDDLKSIEEKLETVKLAYLSELDIY